MNTKYCAVPASLMIAAALAAVAIAAPMLPTSQRQSANRPPIGNNLDQLDESELDDGAPLSSSPFADLAFDLDQVIPSPFARASASAAAAIAAAAQEDNDGELTLDALKLNDDESPFSGVTNTDMLALESEFVTSLLKGAESGSIELPDWMKPSLSGQQPPLMPSNSENTQQVGLPRRDSSTGLQPAAGSGGGLILSAAAGASSSSGAMNLIQSPSLETLILSFLNPQPAVVHEGEDVQIAGKSYRIERKLDEGEFGQTFLAKTESRKHQVALKEYKQKGIDTLRDFARERTGLEMAGRLLAADPARRLLVQEYFAGRTVQQILDDDEVSDVAKAELKRRFFEALRQFHRDTGMSHGDPHPGNAIVDDTTGDIHFVDMGHTMPLTSSTESVLIDGDMEYAERNWGR